MTDISQQTLNEAPKRNQSLRTEFVIYFTIIFIATLPLATLSWGLTALRGRCLPENGPLKRAWSQARIITPMIFSA